MIDAKYLSGALTERFGLAVDVKNDKIQEGHRIIIKPQDIEYTISFQVELILGWRSIKATFRPGNFAASLIRDMNSASPEQKMAFSVFANSLISKGAQVKLILNKIEADAVSTENWPANWTDIQISMRKIGVVIEKDSDYDFDAAFPWATGFLGMCLALLPLEPISESEYTPEKEGAEIHKKIKLYERSRINRAACIEINGTACKICGINFGKVYGSLGEGFIHVHHITPVSQMGGSYILNPSKDLIPVCPNCHAMLHRKMPPYSPDELSDILEKVRING